MQIIIHSDNDSFPRLELSTFATKEIFQKLREVSASEHSTSIHEMEGVCAVRSCCKLLVSTTSCCLLHLPSMRYSHIPRNCITWDSESPGAKAGYQMESAHTIKARASVATLTKWFNGGCCPAYSSLLYIRHCWVVLLPQMHTFARHSQGPNAFWLPYRPWCATANLCVWQLIWGRAISHAQRHRGVDPQFAACSFVLQP